jgi:hypothetical protein
MTLKSCTPHAQLAANYIKKPCRQAKFNSVNCQSNIFFNKFICLFYLEMNSLFVFQKGHDYFTLGLS